tara:strand:+ start:919 stop:1194 length:276 start_codon:yes stop_codon:yes gene_type:complete
MEYKYTSPYARFQEWLNQCPVEIVNYVDFTDTFDVTFKVPVEEEVDNSGDFLDSLSEGKEYGSKVDALEDSMGVTDEKVSPIHRRKDMDLL